MSLTKFLIALAMLSASWDNISVDIGGFTFRLTQLAILPVFLFWSLSTVFSGKINKILGGGDIISWIIFQVAFILNSPHLGNAVAYFIWMVFNIFVIFSIVYYSDKIFSSSLAEIVCCYGVDWNYSINFVARFQNKFYQ